MAPAITAPIDRPQTPTEVQNGGSRPWLADYVPGVPADITISTQPLHQIFRGNALRYPNRPAIRIVGRVMTYRELDEAVSRYANVLIELGVRKGDRVTVPLPNCPQMIIAVYGSLRAGAIVVPSSPLAAEGELKHLWRDGGGGRSCACLPCIRTSVQCGSECRRCSTSSSPISRNTSHPLLGSSSRW